MGDLLDEFIQLCRLLNIFTLMSFARPVSQALMHCRLSWMIKAAVCLHQVSILLLVNSKDLLVSPDLPVEIGQYELAARHREDAADPLAKLGGDARMLLEEIVSELELKLFNDRLHFFDDVRWHLLNDKVVELLRTLVCLGVPKQI